MKRRKKVLLGFSGLTIFGILLMFVSFSTDYWMIVTIPGGEYRNASQAYVTGVTVKHIPPRETIPPYLIQCLSI